MKTQTQHEAPGGYAWDSLAGPIYSYGSLSAAEAIHLIRLKDECQIIMVLVWPDGVPELRQYFALTLDQALARAVDIRMRLSAQHRNGHVVCIRPATTAETEALFGALDHLERRLPGPMPAKSVAEVTRIRAMNDHCGTTSHPTLGGNGKVL